MSGNTSATGGYLSPTSVFPEDDDVLASILHDLVVGLTELGGNRVFPRWQSQSPTMPPVTVNWAAVGVTNYDTTSIWPEMVHYDGYSVQTEQQIMDVVVTFYGPNGGSLASRFRSGLLVKQNLEVLETFGIKLHRLAAITRVPELINTQWINRSDVAFGLVRELNRTYAIENVIESRVTFVADITTPPDTSSVEVTET